MAIFNSYVSLPEANPNKEKAHASLNGIDPVMRVKKKPVPRQNPIEIGI